MTGSAQRPPLGGAANAGRGLGETGREGLGAFWGSSVNVGGPGGCRGVLVSVGEPMDWGVGARGGPLSEGRAVSGGSWHAGGVMDRGGPSALRGSVKGREAVNGGIPLRGGALVNWGQGPW